MSKFLSWLGSLTRDSLSNFAVRKVPADKITSSFAAIEQVSRSMDTPTPLAMLFAGEEPENRILSTVASVIMIRLECLEAGPPYCESADTPFLSAGQWQLDSVDSLYSAWGRGQRIKPLLQALAMGVFGARLRTENWIESLGEAIVSVSLTRSMPTTLQMLASRVVILVQCTLVGSDEVLRDKDEAGTPKGRELFASSRRNAVGRTEVTPCWRYAVGQLMCYAPSWSHAGRRVMKQSSMINPFAPKHLPLLHTCTNKKEPCNHSSPPKCRLGRMIPTPEITGDKVMHQIAAEVGTWNILILNAGHLTNPTSIASANLFNCWTILTYEVRSHSLFPQR